STPADAIASATASTEAMDSGTRTLPLASTRSVTPNVARIGCGIARKLIRRNDHDHRSGPRGRGSDFLMGSFCQVITYTRITIEYMFQLQASGSSGLKTASAPSLATVSKTRTVSSD